MMRDKISSVITSMCRILASSHSPIHPFIRHCTARAEEGRVEGRRQTAEGRGQGARGKGQGAGGIEPACASRIAHRAQCLVDWPGNEDENATGGTINLLPFSGSHSSDSTVHLKPSVTCPVPPSFFLPIIPMAGPLVLLNSHSPGPIAQWNSAQASRP